MRKRGMALSMIALGITLFFCVLSCSVSGPRVVCYCAQDRMYATELFRDFAKQAGIKVHPLFDNEAVKTVGLANRLMAERNQPQCDIFWGNEEMRTRQMATQDVFRATNGWAAFGYRSRRLVINTNLVSLDVAPHSLLELTNEFWRGKVALAYPQFGTTATHFHALRQHWGPVLWESWCRGLAANHPFLVDGNSVVVKFVGRGQAWLGLTDSDDIGDGLREGLPVIGLPINAETLLLPNTVAITRGAPDPDNAQRLFEFLQRRETVECLIKAGALEGFSPQEVRVPTLKVDWRILLRDVEPVTAKLNAIFLR